MRCYKCHEDKPESEFYKIASKQRGYDEYCKPCRRARSRQNYKRNPKPYRERSIAWGKDNAERRRIREREDYADGKSKKYKIDANHRRRARLANVPYERIDINELFKRDRGICHLCNKRVNVGDISVDHVKPIALGGAHTWDNVKLAHLQCNIKRGIKPIFKGFRPEME